ncbi:MAG: hypothetical protein ACOC70_02135, partial [bacterium]
AHMQTARIQKAKGQLGVLESALAQYESAHGDYPPSGGSGENAGNEVLLDHLLHAEGGPFINPKVIRDWLGDTDGDGARELLDPWNNPWIYIHHSYYAGDDVYYMIQGQRLKVEPAQEQNRPLNRTTYQLWACGPNEANQAGQDDDVGNVRR